MRSILNFLDVTMPEYIEALTLPMSVRWALVVPAFVIGGLMGLSFSHSVLAPILFGTSRLCLLGTWCMSGDTIFWVRFWIDWIWGTYWWYWNLYWFALGMCPSLIAVWCARWAAPSHKRRVAVVGALIVLGMCVAMSFEVIQVERGERFSEYSVLCARRLCKPTLAGAVAGLALGGLAGIWLPPIPKRARASEGAQ